MYVHVVADNVAAAALYEGQGYSQEAEESESYARALRRPRRRLLHLALS
jgi:ribosomal protein S18 acetylase RimI-like enzyme